MKNLKAKWTLALVPALGLMLDLGLPSASAAGDFALGQVPVEVNTAHATFRLLARTSSTREVWVDETAGLVVSDIVSGFYSQAEAEKLCADKSYDPSHPFTPASLAMDARGYLTDLSWRLPTGFPLGQQDDYVVLEADGFRNVVPRGSEDLRFWTTSTPTAGTIDTHGNPTDPTVYVFTAADGKFHVTKRQFSGSVRCVAYLPGREPLNGNLKLIENRMLNRGKVDEIHLAKAEASIVPVLSQRVRVEAGYFSESAPDQFMPCDFDGIGALQVELKAGETWKQSFVCRHTGLSATMGDRLWNFVVRATDANQHLVFFRRMNGGVAGWTVTPTPGGGWVIGD
ncbi:hypothetical protein WDW37_06530 [Bdellovibrionota bacterium FG-1]